MGTTPQIQNFARAASQFCAWAESAPLAAEADASAALQHLSVLYQLAFGLPQQFGDEEPAEVPHDAWERIYERFGSLPFNYYAQCSSPVESLTDPPEIADLADDLADIWRDLTRGLSLFHAGHIDAATWEWRNSFWQHWGHHAAGGIFALHGWLVEHSQMPPNNSFKGMPLRGTP